MIVHAQKSESVPKKYLFNVGIDATVSEKERETERERERETLMQKLVTKVRQRQ